MKYWRDQARISETKETQESLKNLKMNDLTSREKAIICGLFLSKFDTDGLSFLDFKSFINIERALALMDPRGTDVVVSQAMTIVRVGFDKAKRRVLLSPELLVKSAHSVHPKSG